MIDVNVYLTNRITLFTSWYSNTDKLAFKLFQSTAGHKNIISVDATAIRDLGGGLRRLSWEAMNIKTPISQTFILIYLSRIIYYYIYLFILYTF